jgi:hypothetical protein
MKLPKTADQFVTSLNDMLTESEYETLQHGETLKIVNRLLGTVAPGFCLVTVQSISGQLLGFSAQQDSTHGKTTPTSGTATQG